MYKALRGSSCILRLVDGACIPPDDRNVDYRAVLAWLAAGNQLQPADPAPAPSQDELDAAAAKAYAKLKALMGLTPAQVQAWVDANVVDLASARDAIKTLAIGVSVLGRRL